MKHKILPGEEVKQPIAPGHLCLALKVNKSKTAFHAVVLTLFNVML